MQFKVVGLGEVLWDELLTGLQLGGAPANFAYHAHALGAEAHVISRIGSDERGREITRRFHEMGLSASTLQVDESAATGSATVEVLADGLAHFTIRGDVAWDRLVATEEALAAARSADAICFGSLAQRSGTSRQTIRQLVAAAPASALKVFDINLRQKFYSREVIEDSLRLANVLKLNDEELPTLAAMFNLAGAATMQVRELANVFKLQTVALTRGAKGGLLYQTVGGEQRWSDCASRAVTVVDTVGAGDSFTAALVLGLLQGMDLDEINSIANEVARFVCSQAGATPPLPAAFAKRFRGSV
jgi:fructokinase